MERLLPIHAIDIDASFYSVNVMPFLERAVLSQTKPARPSRARESGADRARRLFARAANVRAVPMLPMRARSLFAG